MAQIYILLQIMITIVGRRNLQLSVESDQTEPWYGSHTKFWLC
jgi:hypothetical protein